MAFSRPTLSELITRTQTDLETRLGADGKFLRRSIAAVLARVWAGLVHLLYGFLDWIFAQAMPDTAEAEALDRHCSLWGVTRKAATFAQFNVTLVGAEGAVIPIDTVLKRSDGVEYTTQAQATLVAGTATVSVICSDAGETGNTAVGAKLNLLSPIAGVTSAVTVGAATETAEDEEKDAELLSRLLDRIQNPPHGGNENDYKQWAKEVAGVTRVWVYPDHLGIGTVGVAFVMDAKNPIIPDAADVTSVQGYIDARRPVTADVTVFAPIADPVAFTITLTPNTLAVRAAVEAELKDLFKRDAQPAGTILLSRIREAISVAAGETDHSITAPAANYTATTGRIPTVGAITWL